MNQRRWGLPLGGIKSSLEIVCFHVVPESVNDERTESGREAELQKSAQNALEVDTFRSKVKIFFWGGGTAPFPDPSPSGKGETPSPHPTPPRRLWRLDTRACGARPWPFRLQILDLPLTSCAV